MGFDTIRFVELNEDLEEELTCIICCGILREPVVTHCGHTFCRDCVNRWIKTERSCPVCRKPCHKLSKPPVLVTNLLGKLKIKCEHEDRGCSEVMTLDRLHQHIAKCPFKQKKGFFKTFFSSLFAPFSSKSEPQDLDYETEVVDDYINRTHLRSPGRNRSRSEDVLSYSLQSAALVGFLYNIFSMLRVDN